MSSNKEKVSSPISEAVSPQKDGVFPEGNGVSNNSNGIEEWVRILSSHGDTAPYYSHLDPVLLRRQVELEASMRAEGLMREEANVKKNREKHNESQSSYGRVLVSDYTHRLALGVEKLMESVKSGKKGFARNSLRYILTLEPHIIAFITLKTIINYISERVTLQTLAKMVSTGLEDELKCRFFEETAKEAYKIAMYRKHSAPNDHRKRTAISAMMGAVKEGRYTGIPMPELEWKRWDGATQLNIGVKLIQVVVETTGLIQVSLGQHQGRRGQKLYYVKHRPELETWIKDWIYHTGLMAPHYMPCVIPPKPYTTPFDGGYHTPLVERLPLVKVPNDPGYLKVIASQENIERMSPVYEAVNLAQNTAWKINTKVLDVMSQLWNDSIIVDCLPRREDYPLPVCPKCGQPLESNDANDKRHPCFVDDPEALRIWKKQASFIHAANRRAFSKRLLVHRILWMAEKFRDDKAIYFPYQLDFRGRLYAAAQLLNPQGSDYAKGLLTFAEGKPIESQEAADWLAIHVANTAGHDKLSFEDRIKWTEDNTPMIQAIADDPIEHRKFWTEADSPFCFLAACFEWAEFKSQGFGYMSSLPIAQDGTCSGLQHYSAMLRDSVGGSAVNLVPADKPQDIYRVVAEKVIEVLESYTPENVPMEDYILAQEWLSSNLINRKITKRAVMTLPYGSTLYTAKEYIRDYVEEVREKNPELVPWALQHEVMTREEYNRTAYEEGVGSDTITTPTGKACSWLGKIVWDCIHSTVIAASEAMAWLQKTADIVAGDAGKPLSWITPTGFIVLQRYVQMNARRLTTELSGDLVFRYTPGHSNQTALKTFCGDDTQGQTKTSVKLTLLEETDQLDPKGQRQGIAPNFVHSMDASALVFAVIEANHKYGIEHFALIHDSFGAHAGGEGQGDSAHLAKAIRDSFVRMYEEHDVLASFEAQMLHAVEEELCSGKVKSLPERPKKGTLSLQQVKESRYFFS